MFEFIKPSTLFPEKAQLIHSFVRFDNFPNDQGRRKVHISSISHLYLSDTMEPFDVHSTLRRRPSLYLFLFIIQMLFIAIARIEALPDIIKIGGLFDISESKQEVAFRYA